MLIGKKVQDGENLFFKALANWKILVNIEKLFMVQESCSWSLSVKLASWKGKWSFTKSRLDVEFVKKTNLEMIIGQQMKADRLDQND